jgi:hypothetical protein
MSVNYRSEQRGIDKPATESGRRSGSVPALRASYGTDPSGGLWAAAGRSSALPARAARGLLAAFIFRSGAAARAVVKAT